MRSGNESLGTYSPHYFGGREIAPGSIEYVESVFKRILDEMSDERSTATMFEPYAKVVNFVLSNRRIKQQVTENPSE